MKGNNVGHDHGQSHANGPAIAGHLDWQLAELMASQPNQFRDGQ